METETCSTSRLSSFVCQSYITLIRLSLYESSIRSSVPTSYGSLVLYLSHSTKEKLCVKSLVVLLYILGFSLCQCHPKELEGDSWFVAELQWNMQRFVGGLVSECVCVCERARERSRLRYCLLCLLSHGQIAEQKGRLAGGHTLPSSGLHCRWYAENELSYLDAERPNLTWWLRHAQDHTETFFVVVVVFPQTF